MTRHNPLLCTVSAAMICFGAVAAAAQPADVATILDESHRASGESAWESATTLHTVSQVTRGGGTSLREHWEDVATGRYVTIDASARTTTRSGFDGVSEWQQGPSGIAYTMGDVDSSLVAADESFRVSRAWWFRERHAATIALIGERSENGRDFDVLSITPEGGRCFEAWFDRSTHLLFLTDEQQAENRVVTTYADYRFVDGLMLPFSVRSGDGKDASFDEVETVQSVEVNPTASDQRYAIPAVPAADIELPPGRDTVQVKFRLAADNRILIPITLNGRVAVEADFDSGGSLVLQPESVKKLGIHSAGRIREGGGGEESASGSTGSLESLEIGEARIRAPLFDSFGFDPDAPEQALVGLEILQRFVVRFDFDRMLMTLTRPEAFRYDEKGAVVPFHFQDNQPEVKGSIDGIAGLFAIDTGDNSSLLLIAPFARRYKLVERYAADIPYEGQAVTATQGVWARKRPGVVAFDGADGRPAVEVHDPVTRISLQHSGFDANRNVSANIGLGILRQFNLTFDYSRQRLIFEPNHFYGQTDIFNRTGLRLKREQAGWIITTIFANSPALDVGLKVGDRIETVNGKTADEFGEGELNTVLKGPLGSTIRMRIAGANRGRDVWLKLRDVL